MMTEDIPTGDRLPRICVTYRDDQHPMSNKVTRGMTNAVFHGTCSQISAPFV